MVCQGLPHSAPCEAILHPKQRRYRFAFIPVLCVFYLFYSKHKFSMLFQGLLQVASQRALWGGLLEILQIFEDFGIPLGLPFGTIFPQKVGSETESKKS